ncbi:MAG: type II toxin-antitoxin system VapC family toxin [Pseudonocardia sp.]
MTPHVLLDTSVVISPPSGGIASIARTVSVSAITIAELQFGVGAAGDPIERHRRGRRLQAVADALDVIPFTLATAEPYGVLSNLLRVAGRNPRPRRLDLLIAATAVRHHLPLLTRNPDDFRHLERALDVVAVS